MMHKEMVLKNNYCLYVLGWLCVMVRAKFIFGGLYQKKSFQQSQLIRIYRNVGPNMCVRRCLQFSRCNGVNFIRDELRCDLLQIVPGDIMSNITRSWFTKMDLWKKDEDGCWPDNPCTGQLNSKCIATGLNEHFCQSHRDKAEEVIAHVTSPGYPNVYGDNFHESNTFTAEVGTMVGVRFKAFDTELNFDFVKLYDGSSGELLAKFSGKALPRDIRSPGNKLQVEWTTDVSIVDTGFSADVYKITM